MLLPGRNGGGDETLGHGRLMSDDGTNTGAKMLGDGK